MTDASEAQKSDRRSKAYVVTAEGRDAGKTFILTEKSAMAAEMWALRVFLALARTGLQIPEELKAMGLMGLAILSIDAARFMQFDDAKVVLSELMECVKIVPDPDNNPDFSRPLVENDISEIRTLLMLKREVLELHLGFSLADADQLGALILAAAEQTKSTSSATRMSPEP